MPNGPSGLQVLVVDIVNARQPSGSTTLVVGCVDDDEYQVVGNVCQQDIGLSISCLSLSKMRNVYSGWFNGWFDVWIEG